MYFEDGALVRTQNWDSIARYGDACYETMAFALSYFYTSKGHEYHPKVNHKIFLTPDGTIRHPKYNEGVKDQTEDQEMLLFVFCKTTGNDEDAKFIMKQCSDWRTGNGNLISPAYWAEIKDWMWLRCLCQLAQAIFFLFPYWNDGNFKEWKDTLATFLFELSWREKWEHRKNIFYRLTYFWPICSPSDRTDGYTKWAIIARDTYWPFRKLIAREKLKQKILAYMWREIESQKDIDTTVLIIQTHFAMVDSL